MNDVFQRVTMFLYALGCFGSWLALTWMIILGYQDLNPGVVSIAWVLFAILSLFGIPRLSPRK